MSIPINPVSPRVQYTATGAQTVFNVPFPFFANADLAVYLTPSGSEPDDLADILVYSTDYTVTGADNENGGTVTLNTGAATGDIITIVRDMTEERLSLYLQGGLFTADQVNDDFSRDVMMSQQNQMQTQTLTPHYQYTAPVSMPDLILPQLGAGDCWVMNSSATEIEAIEFSTGGGGSGSVTAILPTTTNALTKFANTGGTIQDSGIIESSAGVITGIVSINGDAWPPDGSVWVSAAINTSMVANNNYYTIAPGGNLLMALPTSIAAGTILHVVGFGSTGWTITQAAGQLIYFGSHATTLGAGGSLVSTNAHDAVELLCVAANTTFTVISAVGNLTYV